MLIGSVFIRSLIFLRLCSQEQSVPLVYCHSSWDLDSLCRSVLFSNARLPIHPFVLSVTKRSKFVDRWTRGVVHSTYYVTAYLFAIPTIFWIVAGAQKTSLEQLITNGWLFHVETLQDQRGIGTQWIYWREFDFSNVELWALRHAITNIVLFVVIGVLDLPI